MKKILCMGLRLDHHTTFIRELDTHFQLIYFSDAKFDSLKLKHAISVESLIGDRDKNLDPMKWTREIAEFYARLAYRLQSLKSGTFPHIEDHLFQVFEHLSKSCMVLDQCFNALCEAVELDLLLTNAEYHYAQRPAVINAKKRGIPVFNIEHGYSAAQPSPKAFRPGYWPSPGMLHIGDVLCVDNRLEEENLLAHEFDREIPHWKNKQVLPLGTPMDSSDAPPKSKTECFSTLGLAPGIKTVVVAPTWFGPSYPGYIQDKLGEIQFYQSMFRFIAQHQKAERIQVLIKAHPAYADNRVYPDWKNGIQHIAYKANMKNLTVHQNFLPEALEVADLVVTNSISSVIWDSSRRGIPTMICMGGVEKNFYRGDAFNPHPLYRGGIIHVATTEAQMEEKFASLLREDTQRNIKRAATRILKEYQISNRRALEKSQAISAWLMDFLGANHGQTVDCQREAS